MNTNEYKWILQYRMFLQQGMEIIIYIYLWGTA